MNMEEYKRRIDNAHTLTGVPSYWEELQEMTKERDKYKELFEKAISMLLPSDVGILYQDGE
jgi:hypothetical protein